MCLHNLLLLLLDFVFFHSVSSRGFIEDAREHPASKSGINTVLSGLMIDAVSAIKCTPQKTIIEASVSAAIFDNFKESPIKSAIS